MNDKKYTYDAQKENAIFARKLRGLFEEQGVTQKKLADYITEKTGESITRQSVGQWCSGNTCPSLKTIPVIANFFGVSTDYLLTDTLVQNPEADVISVCEYTGLTEKAVVFLNELQSRANKDETISELTVDCTTKNYCDKITLEIYEIIDEHPKIKSTIEKYLHYRRNGDIKSANGIVAKYGECDDYKDAFDKARVLLTYESRIKEQTKASIAKSKVALKAVSELLSAPEREEFVTNLTLLFSHLESEFKDKTVKINFSTSNSYEDYECTAEFSDKIIETILLNEIQSYIKGIKTNVYNQQRAAHAFYSFDEKDSDQKEGENENGSNNTPKE